MIISIEKITSKLNFSCLKATEISLLAGYLCDWVLTMKKLAFNYHMTNKMNITLKNTTPNLLFRHLKKKSFDFEGDNYGLN